MGKKLDVICHRFQRTTKQTVKMSFYPNKGLWNLLFSKTRLLGLQSNSNFIKVMIAAIILLERTERMLLIDTRLC